MPYFGRLRQTNYVTISSKERVHYLRHKFLDQCAWLISTQFYTGISEPAPLDLPPIERKCNMNTVLSFVANLIDPKTIMSKVKSVLREIDPEYEKEGQSFIKACTILKSGLDDDVSFTAQDYLDAKDESFASGIIFVIGRGFKLHLDIHSNPVNALAFELDYEDLHEERKMHLLPMARKANSITCIYFEELRTSHRAKLDLLDGIDSYYSYLKTVGYKVAHYYGFVLADQILPHLIPGYYADSVYVSSYRLTLNNDIGVNVLKLK